jgi:hypothetical protein
MAILGRRQPFKPQIINPFAGAQPSVNRLVKIAPVSQRASRRHSFHTQVISSIRPTAWVYIQSASQGFGQSVSARTVALPGNSTIGDLIVVFADWFNTGTIAITDTLGNTYTQVGTTQSVADGTLGAFYFTVSKGSGANSITLTPTGNVYTGLAIAEYRNANPGKPAVDGFSTNDVNNTTTFATGSIPVNFPGDLVVGTFGQAATISYTPGAGWNLREAQLTGTTQLSVILQDELSVSSAINSVGTSTVSTDVIGIGVSFYLANPQIGKATIKSQVVEIASRQPRFRSQVINQIKNYPAPVVTGPVGIVVKVTLQSRLAGRPRTKTTVHDQLAISNRQPSKAKLTFTNFAGMHPGRPVTRNRITNQFATRYVPPVAAVLKRVVRATFVADFFPGRPQTKIEVINQLAKSYPQPLVKLLARNIPLIVRIPSSDQRIRRFSEVVANIVDSLAGQGILVQTGPEDYTLAIPFQPLQLDNVLIANNTVFFSTTLGKLAYKDSSGVVHPLY